MHELLYDSTMSGLVKPRGPEMQTTLEMRLWSVFGRINYFIRFTVHPDELSAIIDAIYQELIKIRNSMTLEDRIMLATS